MSSITITNKQSLLRKMGMAAFTFFLVKGLLWMAAPFFFLWLAHA